tara:strand:- start:796 stop:975 length:180 start_codon:yes stop_codon:yes gene_type:complete
MDFAESIVLTGKTLLGQVGATTTGEEGLEAENLNMEVFVFGNESESFHFSYFLYFITIT